MKTGRGSRSGLDGQWQAPAEGRGAAGPGGSARPLEAALDVLDRFGQALQQCAQSRQQIQLTLASVRDCIGADAVYWDPGSTADAVEALGPVTLPPEWYQAFTARLLADEGAAPAQVLRPRLPGTGDPAPGSAALVRISRSHGSWLGAVNFTPSRPFDAGDLKVMQFARRMLLNHRQQVQAQGKLRDSLFGLVRCLAAAIDAKDSYTWGHSERVARIAVRLGQQMGLTPATLSDLYLAGLLHDIGKIGVRDSVLLKPGVLSDEERCHMQEHAAIGDRMLSVVSPLGHLRPGVRNHHERFDGRGYPDRLAGDAIPLMARILAVADSCDAMMADRPYRPALAPAQIDRVMAEGAGAQWDAALIGHFMACRHDLYPICQRGLGDSVIAAVDRVLERVPSAEDSSR